MKRVVLIWLDAFSSRYLDPQKTPFISELSRSGLNTTLKPLFAFAGIGVSAFTGVTVNTHGIWCDCVLRKSKSTPPLFKWLLSLCGWLPDDTLDQYSRNIVHRIFGYYPGFPNVIPVELVDFFETKEEKKLTNENPIQGVVTFFDQLRKCKVKYFVSGFGQSVFESISEGLVVRRTLKALDNDYRFVMFHLESLDRLGHKYGPESEKIQRRVGEIDEIVKKVVQRGMELDASTSFVIFSDHGMAPITGHVDLLSLLKRLPVKMRQDYIVFLNSTVANFWFKTQKAKDLIIEELGRVEQGMILDKPELEELEIDEIGSEYGDLLFALREGNVFFPDFYRRRKSPKGMHGYAFSSYDKPPFIIYSPDISYRPHQGAKAKFIDVMPTILDLLELPIPSTCEGRSLLKG